MPSHPKLRVTAMRAFIVLSLLLAVLLVTSCCISFSYDRSATITIVGDGPGGTKITHRTFWVPMVAVNAGCCQVWSDDHIDKGGAWRLNADRTALGIVWKFSRSPDPVRNASKLVIPLWAPLLLTLLPIVLLLRTARSRLRAGLCPACAYDRKSLPPAAPCPECGSK